MFWRQHLEILCKSGTIKYVVNETLLYPYLNTYFVQHLILNFWILCYIRKEVFGYRPQERNKAQSFWFATEPFL